MADHQYILEIIKQARKNKGFTQADMAQQLGISQNAYKDIEIGKTELKVKTLQQIELVLDIQLLAPPANNAAVVKTNDDTNVPPVDLELLLGQNEIRRKLESIENDQREIKSFLQKLLGGNKK